MYKLVIEDDEGRTTIVPLIRDEITIGRKEGNTIRLTERNVSRRHARLVKANGGIQIEDLGSYNGIKVNGQKIQARTSVRSGDRILIGDYQLSIQADGAQDAKAPEATDEAPTTAVPRQAAKTAIVRSSEVQPRAGAPTGASTRARLVVLNSNLAGLDFQITKPEVVLGRTEDNDIVINHRSISRNHAKVVLEGESYKIIDLGSANGVRVNGEDYGKVELRRGDIIELGHVKLRYVSPGEPFIFDPRVDKLADGPGAKSPLALAAIAAVVVIGGGIGAWVVFGGDDSNRGSSVAEDDSSEGDDDDTSGSSKVDDDGAGGDGDSALDEARSLIDRREWTAAVGALEKLSGPEAEALAKKAELELGQEELFGRCLTFIEAKNDEEALTECDTIDRSSVYWPEVDPKLSEVKARLVATALAEAETAYKDKDATAMRRSIEIAKVSDSLDSRIGDYERKLAELERTSGAVAALTPTKPKGPKPKGPDKPAKPPKTAAPAAVPPAGAGGASSREKAKEEYVKGLRLFATNHNSEAINAFKKAIKIDPRFPDAHRALGSIYVRLGNLKGMCREFKTYVKLAPHASDTTKIKGEMAKYAATVSACRAD